MTAHLHTCSTSTGDSCSAHDQKPFLKTAGKPTLSVDMHCHILTSEVERVVQDLPEKQAEKLMLIKHMGQESVEYNSKIMLDLTPKLVDIDVRLQDMNEMGIDVQVLSPSPTQYYYWTPRDVSDHIVELQNDRIAEACAQHPDRFVGLGNVSLQFPDLATKQLEHCVKNLGFRGVEISSQVNGEEICEPKYFPFWRKAEELGAVVFLHPLGTTLGTRVNRYYLSNLIGIPLETTIALSHLIFGGVLDDFPGLKICAAHGGGYLGAYSGRSDHGWEVRPECKKMKNPPSDYLKKMFFDTIVFEPGQLQQLIEQVGVSQVLLGTDYPFDMGDFSSIERIRSLSGLKTEDQEGIIGLNAARLLRIRQFA